MAAVHAVAAGKQISEVLGRSVPSTATTTTAHRSDTFPVSPRAPGHRVSRHSSAPSSSIQIPSKGAEHRVFSHFPTFRTEPSFREGSGLVRDPIEVLERDELGLIDEIVVEELLRWSDEEDSHIGAGIEIRGGRHNHNLATEESPDILYSRSPDSASDDGVELTGTHVMDGVRLAHTTSLRKGGEAADLADGVVSVLDRNNLVDTVDGHTTTTHVWRPSNERVSTDTTRRRSEDDQAAALLGQGVWDHWGGGLDDHDEQLKKGDDGLNGATAAQRIHGGSWRGIGSRNKRGTASAMSSDSVEDALRLHALTLSARAAAAAAAVSKHGMGEPGTPDPDRGQPSNTNNDSGNSLDGVDAVSLEELSGATNNSNAAAIAGDLTIATAAPRSSSSSPSGSSPIWTSMPFTVRNAPLLRVIPKFYGVTHADGRVLLELEDLARWYRHPCIMDIKVGYRTWYSHADPDYIDRCRRKDASTTQAALGFKICGMQVYRHARGGYWRASKRWCKTLPEVVVDKALMSFAHNEHGLRPADVYGGPSGAVAQLRALEAWFEVQEEFHFYSASLLILYEGDAQGAEGANVRVRLVDFAHTFHMGEGDHGEGGVDDNFLGGMKAITSRLNVVSRLDVADTLMVAERSGAHFE